MNTEERREWHDRIALMDGKTKRCIVCGVSYIWHMYKECDYYEYTNDVDREIYVTDPESETESESEESIVLTNASVRNSTGMASGSDSDSGE